nr:ribonuclease H-like domain-containing protein [Tanacetum cinerariifolium]
MDLESSQNNAVAKLPLLKQGDYEMWKLRIKQYFQVQDYALWDVIENGNSFNPVPRVTANVDVSFAEYESKKVLLENWPRNQDSSRKTMIVEDTSSKAMVVIDGADCDFHDKMTVQKPVLKTMEKETGQREVRPIWNNAIRVNHQNFYNLRRNFGSTTVLTKSGIVPISTARQSSSRAATPVSTTRPINTAAPKPIVNVAKTRQNTFQKPHSLSKSPFHQQTTLKNGYLVNTAKVKSVNTVNTVNTAKGKNVTSVVWKQGTNVVKSSACWVWRPKIKGDPQAALRDTGIFDSGCSRHMTGSKSFLSDYQEYDGGFVAFVGSSKGGKKL